MLHAYLIKNISWPPHTHPGPTTVLCGQIWVSSLSWFLFLYCWPIPSMWRRTTSSISPLRTLCARIMLRRSTTTSCSAPSSLWPTMGPTCHSTGRPTPPSTLWSTRRPMTLSTIYKKWAWAVLSLIWLIDWHYDWLIADEHKRSPSAIPWAHFPRFIDSSQLSLLNFLTTAISHGPSLLHPYFYTRTK